MKWLKNLFKKIFGGKDEAPSTPSQPTTPTVPTTPMPPYEPVNTGLKIALIRGHGGGDPGAGGNGTNEVEYNSWVMDWVVAHSSRNIRAFKGSSSANAVSLANVWKPDVAIQMHLNSADGAPKGCEVLVISGDTASYPLAEKFAADFNKHFNQATRRADTKGKKILASSDRGVSSLRDTKAKVRILVEPFFVNNPADFKKKEEYAQFLLDFTNSIS